MSSDVYLNMENKVTDKGVIFVTKCKKKNPNIKPITFTLPEDLTGLIGNK